MPDAKSSRALEQAEAAPSPSSLPAPLSGIADPALKQDSRLHDLSNSGPDLRSPRKIQLPTTGNEPTEILQAAQTTPHILLTKKMQFSTANPNRNGHFQSRNPPSAVPRASQTVSPPLKPPLWTLTAFWKYKTTVDGLSWLHHAPV